MMKLRGGDRTIGAEDLDEAKALFVDALRMEVLEDTGTALVLDAGSKLRIEEGGKGGKIEMETKGLGRLVEHLDGLGFYADGPKETPNGAYADVEGVEGIEVIIWEAK
jgi:hypothetical protein